VKHESESGGLVANELRILDCTFGYSTQVDVFQELSLTFGAGKTVLLGPNGAGKSTLLGLMASIYRPRRGSIELQGIGSPFTRKTASPYRRAVAWLPQHAGTFSGLTVREHVAYAGWLKGMKGGEAWRASSEALRSMGLEEFESRAATKLSGGQTRRMQLAGALVHDARVILLDEPIAGLDPLQQGRFHELVQSLDERLTVVVSSHDVSDLSDSYDRVVVLDEGEVRFDGPVNEFVQLAPSGTDPHRRGVVAYSRLVRGEN
jgi:ABC-2 type transport system ATP-binding protein